METQLVKMKIKPFEERFVRIPFAEAISRGYRVYWNSDDEARLRLIQGASKIAKRARRSREGSPCQVSFTLPVEVVHAAMHVSSLYKGWHGLRLLAYMSAMRDTPGKIREPEDMQWNTVLVGSETCFDISQGLKGVKLQDQLPLAWQAWQEMPEHIRQRAIDAPDSRNNGSVQYKLPIAAWGEIKKIGSGNRSRGARIVLAALASLVSSSRTEAG